MKKMMWAIIVAAVVMTVAATIKPGSFVRIQSFAPEPGYNPVDDIKSWGDPSYMLDHGNSFVGSQSKAETLAIKAQVDVVIADERDRQKRIQAVILIDVIFACLLATIFGLGLAKRRARQTREMSLNLSADALRGLQKAISSIKKTGIDIATRAAERSK